MDTAAYKLAQLKAMLEDGQTDIPALLQAMKEDARVSVQKEAATFMRRMVREEKERERLLSLYTYETRFYNENIYHVAGIDEAGRGPVAGPVMIAAVILPPFWECPGLNDSKKVPPAKRERLYDKIMAEAVAVSCIAKSEKEIDDLDIYHATQQGMYDAVRALSVPAEAVLVDAMPLPDLTMAHQSLVHGDALSASIAAASIIAKVTRDRLMEQYDKTYPEYGFAVHKGYLTALHRNAIETYGPCPIHRRSFEPIRTLTHFHRGDE
jgi:ribonuclease HII